MAPQREYQRVKNLLKAHFGNEYEIATAYMDKVLGWPVVKGENVQPLQDMAYDTDSIHGGVEHSIKHEADCNEVAIQAAGKMEVGSL